MKREVDGQHPIRGYFSVALHESFHSLGLRETDDVEGYLVRMLVEFLHRDGIYNIRDAAGRPVESVVEMVAEGDVRLNADSFEREREVHKHVGDFLLFWSGMFPEFLQHLRAPSAKDALLDCTKQGQLSYYVASTFEHAPYTDEAPTLRKLSEDFEAYQRGLNRVRAAFEGFSSGGWSEGFEA